MDLLWIILKDWRAHENLNHSPLLCIADVHLHMYQRKIKLMKEIASIPVISKVFPSLSFPNRWDIIEKNIKFVMVQNVFSTNLGVQGVGLLLMHLVC